MPIVVELMETLIAEFRSAASVLGPEDVFELERKTRLPSSASASP